MLAGSCSPWEAWGRHQVLADVEDPRTRSHWKATVGKDADASFAYHTCHGFTNHHVAECWGRAWIQQALSQTRRRRSSRAPSPFGPCRCQQARTLDLLIPWWRRGSRRSAGQIAEARLYGSGHRRESPRAPAPDLIDPKGSVDRLSLPPPDPGSFSERK